MALGDDTLSFRARALAQAHPLTKPAKALIDRLAAAQGETQPMEEIGQWAGTAMLTGYCLRTVEEERVGIAPPHDAEVDLDRLDETADDVVTAMRSGQERAVICDGVDVTEVLEALNGIIATEIDRRVDPWREQVGADAWASFEEYIAHFTVKGYAIRAAETNGDGRQ